MNVFNFILRRQLKKIPEQNGIPAHTRKYTVELLAAGIESGRTHVVQVLSGARASLRTRRRLITFFKTNFTPEVTAKMLAALGWDEQGQDVPRETKCSSGNISP